MARKTGLKGGRRGTGRARKTRARVAARSSRRQRYAGRGTEKERDWGRSRGEAGAYREAYELAGPRGRGRPEERAPRGSSGYGEHRGEREYGEYRAPGYGGYGGEREARERYMNDERSLGGDQGRSDYGGFGRRRQEGGRGYDESAERRWGGWSDEAGYGRAYYGGRGYQQEGDERRGPREYPGGGRELSGHERWDDREGAHERLDRFARERYGGRGEGRGYPGERGYRDEPRRDREDREKGFDYP
jgi:hypothetical protein